MMDDQTYDTLHVVHWHLESEPCDQACHDQEAQIAAAYAARRNSEVVRRALRYYFDRGATRAPDTRET